MLPCSQLNLPPPSLLRHSICGECLLLKDKQKSERDFEQFESLNDVLKLLQTKFRDRKLRLKYDLNGAEVSINEYRDDKSIMIVTDPDFKPTDNTLIAYGLLDKYIEIDLSIEEIRGPGYFRCKIKSVRKAKSGRRDLRFKIAPDEAVATNFKVSKHTIDISGFSIPTSIKVLLEQFHSNNSSLGDIVKVNVFEQGDLMQNLVRKTGKTIYIRDVADEMSYYALDDEFLDVSVSLGDDLRGYINENVNRGYKSMILSPLLYEADNGRVIPFAYILVISKSEYYEMEKVEALRKLSERLVERIRDANTVLISVNQQIIDISRGGAKLKITDNELKKYLSASKGFIFDIVFRLQAPITIYGEIRFTSYDVGGDLYIGVDFAGNSSRKNEMKRYYAFIKPMEIEYKNKLVKEMKRKKMAH